MDIVLLIVAILCLVVGLLGCLLPVLPGPPVSWVALLLLKFTHYGAGMSWFTMWLLLLVVVVVSILDYIVPVWGTRKFGGTKAGMWGASIGLVVGLFFSPWGIILGPFIGALVAELIAGSSGAKSFKAAIGAFIGFLFGTGLKLFSSVWITIYFFVSLF